MKAIVRVKLIAETEVEIEVEYNEGEDPADLTSEDERNARTAANFKDIEWQIDDAEEVGKP